MRRRVTLSVLGFIAGPAWANAPADESTAEQAVARRAAEVGNELAGRVMSEGSPNSRATAGYSAANVQFTQDSDETSVSLAFAFNLTSYRAPAKPEDYYRVSQTRLSVVASTPIEKGGKDSGLFAGDSLVSGSKLKLSVTSFSTQVGSGKGAGPEISSAYRQCVGQNAHGWVAVQPDRLKATSDAAIFAAGLDAKLAWREPNVNFDGIMVQTAKEGDLGLVIAKACYPGQDGGDLHDEYDLVSKYGGDSVTFGRRFLPDNAKLTFMGIDASFGREDHTYLDRAAFKLPSVPRTSWEAGAYYGQINSDLTFSWRIRGVYGQTYKDSDEAQICRTVSIPAGTECIKGADGAPLRQRTGLVSVEARKLVTVSDGTQIAIAPQITYKTKDNNIGVEVPVYLVPDEKGKLSGGIKAVYNSKGDEFAIGVFVGVPFSVFY